MICRTGPCTIGWPFAGDFFGTSFRGRWRPTQLPRHGQHERSLQGGRYRRDCRTGGAGSRAELKELEPAGFGQESLLLSKRLSQVRHLIRQFGDLPTQGRIFLKLRLE